MAEPVDECDARGPGGGCGERSKQSGDQLATTRGGTRRDVHPRRVGASELGHDSGRLPGDRLGGLTFVVGRRTPEIYSENTTGSN
ncbi:hypothetical protein ACF1BP_24210 [Streptomyces sp. NPDC014735]|uniref:hypothetical protein n=1 Tax=Streptomyces sp. NPDC014735 TaxID=3364887 RepID=UPI0036FD5C63